MVRQGFDASPMGPPQPNHPNPTSNGPPRACWAVPGGTSRRSVSPYRKWLDLFCKQHAISVVSRSLFPFGKRLKFPANHGGYQTLYLPTTWRRSLHASAIAADPSKAFWVLLRSLFSIFKACEDKVVLEAQSEKEGYFPSFQAFLVI